MDLERAFPLTFEWTSSPAATKGSIVVQNRDEASILDESGVAAEAEEIEVERRAGFLLAVTVNGNRDHGRQEAGVERDPLRESLWPDQQCLISQSRGIGTILNHYLGLSAISV